MPISLEFGEGLNSVYVKFIGYNLNLSDCRHFVIVDLKTAFHVPYTGLYNLYLAISVPNFTYIQQC
jgi:hypothetical protein